MKNIPLLVGTLVVTLLLIVGLAFFFSGPSTPKTADPKLLLGSTKDIKGPDNAKVTVVEFGDFECPACKAAEPYVQQLLSQDGTQIRFVFRHFPLTDIHKNALEAAYASEAAASFGKFWEYHDLLYQNQDDWGELPADQAKQKFLDYAGQLQIDKTQFQKKIDSADVQQPVTDGMSDGTKLNIQGTPTFFVNGQETAAPQLLSTVESLLSSTK